MVTFAEPELKIKAVSFVLLMSGMGQSFFRARAGDGWDDARGAVQPTALRADSTDRV